MIIVYKGMSDQVKQPKKFCDKPLQYEVHYSHVDTDLILLSAHTKCWQQAFEYKNLYHDWKTFTQWRITLRFDLLKPYIM